MTRYNGLKYGPISENGGPYGFYIGIEHEEVVMPLDRAEEFLKQVSEGIALAKKRNRRLEREAAQAIRKAAAAQKKGKRSR